MLRSVYSPVTTPLAVAATAAVGTAMATAGSMPAPSFDCDPVFAVGVVTATTGMTSFVAREAFDFKPQHFEEMSKKQLLAYNLVSIPLLFAQAATMYTMTQVSGMDVVLTMAGVNGALYLANILAPNLAVQNVSD